jgi:hypothetical protein
MHRQWIVTVSFTPSADCTEYITNVSAILLSRSREPQIHQRAEFAQVIADRASSDGKKWSDWKTILRFLTL